MMEIDDEEDGNSGTLLPSLPDDVLAIISATLLPADICNLALTCRSLRRLAASDKLWLPQCERLRLITPLRRLHAWRPAFTSYKSLARFLILARPLLGLWVHQNPELGNVVFAFFGFASLVACRVIPQDVPTAGLLWAPVFEVVARPDGSPILFLHGRHSDGDFVHPGSLAPLHPNPNLLLLEVSNAATAADFFTPPPPIQPRLGHSKSHGVTAVTLTARAICRSDTTIPRTIPNTIDCKAVVTFGRLPFGDRRRLLELVADLSRVKASGLLAGAFILPGEKQGEEAAIRVLSDRRSELLNCHNNFSPVPIDAVADRLVPSRPVKPPSTAIENAEESVKSESQQQVQRSTSMSKRFANNLMQIIKKAGLMTSNADSSSNSNSIMLVKSGCSTTSEKKHAQLHEFLKTSSNLGLRMRASKVNFSSYRAWPNIHDNKFALYKLPLQRTSPDQEYAGLWGGAFGWPPGRASDEKPAKALFIVLISYEECDGMRCLIGTKILEGTHYVLHPNGSAMFVAKLDEPCSDTFPFPWKDEKTGQTVAIKCAYSGDGIANGYGFRYPGSKPGSLYATECGHLVFVWKESRSVLALQRFELEDMVRNGENVPPLSPVANFAYLTKSYSNVFTSMSTAIHPLSSPR